MGGGRGRGRGRGSKRNAELSMERIDDFAPPPAPASKVARTTARASGVTGAPAPIRSGVRDWLNAAGQVGVSSQPGMVDTRPAFATIGEVAAPVFMDGRRAVASVGNDVPFGGPETGLGLDIGAAGASLKEAEPR